MGWKSELVQVAESLGQANQAMGSFAISDMTIGLAYLSEKRKKDFDFDRRLSGLTLSGAQECPAERLKQFAWASELAEISYAKDESLIRKYLLAEHDLVLCSCAVESKFQGADSSPTPP